MFCATPEAKTLVEDRQRHYNQVCLHAALDRRLAAPETVVRPGPPGQRARPSWGQRIDIHNEPTGRAGSRSATVDAGIRVVRTPPA